MLLRRILQQQNESIHDYYNDAERMYGFYKICTEPHRGGESHETSRWIDRTAVQRYAADESDLTNGLLSKAAKAIALQPTKEYVLIRKSCSMI